MLHQSGFEVNAQSTDALDFARRNTHIKATKGCPQVLALQAASRAIPAWETATFQISSVELRLFRISKCRWLNLGRLSLLETRTMLTHD
jgi:hypothetical protein